MRKRRHLFSFILGLGLIGWAMLYRMRRQIIRQRLGLPPVLNDVRIERDLAIPMRDGVRLVADHYIPKAEGSFPTVLIRSCYGRGAEPGPTGQGFRFIAERFAERGYHVIVQSTRGSYGSEGEFIPLVDEASDGQDTIKWIARQPWFNGALGMWGPSYLGYVQWAVATTAPAYLKALVPIITFSNGYSASYPSGGFALDTALRIGYVFYGEQEEDDSVWDALRWYARLEKAVAPGLCHLPLGEADEVITGRPNLFYRQSLRVTNPDDPSWQKLNFHSSLEQVAAPVLLISGWYDMFLNDLLEDYTALREAGRNPRLTVGPWYHVDLNWMPLALQQSLAWFDTHMKGLPPRLPERPVQIYVLGAKEWREEESWPPPARQVRYFLRSEGSLSVEGPEPQSAPDRYRYDPADPTPTLGGPLLFPPAGPVDNRELEARPDVLCYSTPRLEEDVEVIGPVRLELYVRSSLAHTDFVGRLCDVHPNGRSINLCDGLFRVEPGQGKAQPDGSLRLDIELWPTANRFLRGHRIRLQVCSGSHPRWNRNLGTGEPLDTGTEMAAAEQTIYHDREHPSALVLPLTAVE